MFWLHRFSYKITFITITFYSLLVHIKKEEDYLFYLGFFMTLFCPGFWWRSVGIFRKRGREGRICWEEGVGGKRGIWAKERERGGKRKKEGARERGRGEKREEEREREGEREGGRGEREREREREREGGRGERERERELERGGGEREGERELEREMDLESSYCLQTPERKIGNKFSIYFNK